MGKILNFVNNRIITPFNPQRKKDKYDLSAEVGNREVNLMYQQSREDTRVYQEYVDGQIDTLKQISEARHKAIKDVMDLATEEVWKPEVEKNKVYHKKDYEKFLKKLNKVQRLYPVTLDEFVFIHLYPKYIYDLGFYPKQAMTSGYKIYHEQSARYFNNHQQLQKDFEKEYL